MKVWGILRRDLIMHKRESIFLAFSVGFYVNFCIASGNSTASLAQHPPPRPPHPPPPKPTVSSPPSSTFIILTPSTRSSTTAATESGSTNSQRCKFGSDSSYTNYSSVIVTEPGLLYIYSSSSGTECAGFIHWWTICLWSKSQDATGSVTLLVLRNSSNQTYVVTSVQTYDIEVVGTNYDKPTCVQLRNKDGVMVEEGDFIGFICNGLIHMAMVVVQPPPQTKVEQTAGGLRVYQQQYKSLTSNSINVSLEMNIQSSFLHEIKHNNLSVVPQLNAILGNTSTITATDKPCTEETDILKSIEFLSLLVSAASVIIVLLTLTLIMACCLWRLNCYSKCPCQKKRQVTHIVQVEPTFEQSMVYNEMYIASNPIERTLHDQVMPNPAYNLDQSRPLRIGVRDNLEMMTALPSKNQLMKQAPLAETTYDTPTSRLTRKDSDQFRDLFGDLEHTYESVNVVNVA